jgi:hypothetical protein
VGVRRLLQAIFIVVVIAYGTRLLDRQWGAVRELRSTLHTDWAGVLFSSLIVFVSYAVLIATWRATVRAWGDRISVADGARIWFVSNLGRYVPGKVWQIGAMGVLSQEVGVSPVAAVGSALVVSVVHVLVGFAVVGLTGAELLARYVPTGIVVPVVLALMAGAVIASPWLLPPLVRLAARLSGRALAVPALPPRAIWVAAAGSLLAWLLFGVAFRVLALSLLGRVTGDVATYVAVFTLSYLLGFVTLIAPGGIGVREESMRLLLVGAGLATTPEATWLVVASRLWLTVLEIVPGALLLAWPRKAPSSVPPTVPE